MQKFQVRNVATGQEQARTCTNNNPRRNAYFGDLHVHTGFSSDAYTQGVRAEPHDAYRFSFGVPVSTETRVRMSSQASSKVSRATWDTLDRPLDFMAVTDHAEFLGETRLCHAGDVSSKFCRALAEGDPHSRYMLKFVFSPSPDRDGKLCGRDDIKCEEALRSAWQKTIDAAEHWNDTSDACERTTFIGYEYTSHRLGSNLHRNVIFKNARVLENPVSYMDTTREWDLWKILDQQCLNDPKGCDAISIPHNSNLSNGRMFAVDYPRTFSEEAQRKRATLRAKIEPIVEIMQHKGNSECYMGLPDVAGGKDEFCNFEKVEHTVWQKKHGDERPGQCYDGPLADWLPRFGPTCLSSLSYVRYALTQGLDEWRRLGVNPYKFGIIAGTDTHNATGGAVDDYNFNGHLGNLDNTAKKRLNRMAGAGSVGDNPGGLTGIWAKQNTRADLFQAMKKREVFGTSGPRIRPRFFGGWSYKGRICNDPNWLERAYGKGVPMGEDLRRPRNSNSVPIFVVHALPDAGTPESPGQPIQQLQIVKGWMDDDNIKQERVYTIARNNRARGDNPQSCAASRNPQPLTRMCGVWRDPDFDNERASVYYARVIQAPTCRYTHKQCQALSKEEKAKHAICAGDKYIAPKMVRERAWTSPIWYTPATNTN
jgi:hypothetical protein